MPTHSGGPAHNQRYDLWLLSPYFGLHEPAHQSLHAAGLAIAFHELNADVEPTPVQLHPPAALRRMVAQQVGLPVLGTEEPGALPDDLWSDRWRQLVHAVETRDARSPAERLRLAILLCALALDAAATQVLAHTCPADPGADDLSAMLAMKRAQVEKRNRPTEDSATQDRHVLACVAQSTQVNDRLALSAALTLLVLSARGRDPQLTEVAQWRAIADQRFRALDTGDWRDLLLISTYWRAVSYQPFLLGEPNRMEAELDQAEEAGVELGRLTNWSVAALQNMHPLRETRTRAALSRGDLPTAIHHASELASGDPYDGKTWILLGDVQWAAGEHADASVSYERAAALGAPYAPKARHQLARCLEACDRIDEALEAYLAVVDDDVYAYSAWEGAHRLATRTGRRDVLSWARSWAAGSGALLTSGGAL